MADKKQTDSTKKEESQATGFNCCSGNFEDIQKKMNSFFGGDKSSSDCCAKFQSMCCEPAAEPKDE